MDQRRPSTRSDSPAGAHDKPYTPRAQATRERVLKAAHECLVELGPMGTSSNEIARRAGVSWGVIQYHFGTRDGILVALVSRGFGGLRQRLEAIDVGNPDLESRLTSVVNCVWDYHTQPDYLLYADTVRALRSKGTEHLDLDRSLRRTDDELASLLGKLLEPVLPSDGPSVQTVQRLIFATTRGLAVTRSIRSPKRAYLNERSLLVNALVALLDTSD